MGRGHAHFFDHGAQLANRAELADPYEAEGRRAGRSKAADSAGTTPVYWPGLPSRLRSKSD
jgi:hypothetical protein